MNGVAFAIAAMMAAVSAQPRDPAITDRVDLVEINHYYDPQGRLVFDQVIFYEWSSKNARFDVVAWRLLKTPAQVPTRDWKRGGYVTSWRDGDVLRQVRSTQRRETWTQHDPELVERDYLPRELRRGLSRQLAER
ncbi:hypothetical protein [Blastopirellula marina]|uniref:Uncharacterized protein n=1 Tax=Blastopirellula marina TaxID=124 RepID=A0A2S8GJX3_9BACT|nr:hypothetical protein [Blastopirellula marina]PQO44334.1 hypothetical protein C5Y93_20450 [Blastopirellula marina]